VEIPTVKPVDATGDLPMCSGCSGDYAGDLEELGDSVSESNSSHRAACWGRPKSDGNGLSDESVGGFEDNWNAQWGSSRTSVPGFRAENGAEICEIFVNATHIVEIRVFAVDSERMRKFLEDGTGDVRVP
jgi:hypothetical protein